MQYGLYCVLQLQAFIVGYCSSGPCPSPCFIENDPLRDQIYRSIATVQFQIALTDEWDSDDCGVKEGFI